MKPIMIAASVLGFALALGACKKHQTDNTTASASASASAAPAASETAAAPSASASGQELAEAPPPDSAKVPTPADYEKKAAQTAASQSLDSQVNALEKQITGK